MYFGSQFKERLKMHVFLHKYGWMPDLLKKKADFLYINDNLAVKDKINSMLYSIHEENKITWGDSHQTVKEFYDNNFKSLKKEVGE